MTDFLAPARAALQAGRRDEARSILATLLRSPEGSKVAEAWHLLSLALDDPKQQADCRSRAVSLGLNPTVSAFCTQCGAAQSQESNFCTQCGNPRTTKPSSVNAPETAQPPQPNPASSPPPAASIAKSCSVPGCTESITKAGHTLCYTHWKAQRTKASQPTPEPEPVQTAQLSATALGERLGRSSREVNLLLAELGWITKRRDGWESTASGRAVGAVDRVHPQSKTSFVIWPESVLSHPAIRGTVVEQQNEPQVPEQSGKTSNFRERFPAQHRTTDGHWVRSRAEQLIDNWLYMSGIVHAYERQLPIPEEAYCDFYVPQGKVYLEYWGMEHDAAYRERQQAKRALYAKYHLQLIEITDEHIRNLDDHLPRLLMKYGVQVD